MPGLSGMAEKIMTATCVMHEETGSLESANDLPAERPGHRSCLFDNDRDRLDVAGLVGAGSLGRHRNSVL
jgi:hypothetical protein